MRVRGFTLMELLLVLALIAVLASLVAPSVTSSIGRAKESALKEDLYTLRKALDDYYADNGSYPPSLEILVEKRYLRRIPVDPVTNRRDSWKFIYQDRDVSGKDGGIKDVHSGSDEKSVDGTPYSEW